MLGRIMMTLSLCAFTLNAKANNDTISLGGSVTEIIYALGQEHHLMAVDLSSMYPEQTADLPQVGYYRTVSVEGLVAMMPKLILASENAGPKEALEEIEKLGIKVQRVSDKGTLSSLYERIEQIAAALSAEEQGDVLLSSLKQHVDEALAAPSTPHRAALVVNRTGTLQAAGTGTSADELMRLANLENIFSTHRSYKPISQESFVSLQPEVIITTTHSIETTGGLDKFVALPAIANTPAAQHQRIIVLDDLLALGMGPRVHEAIQLLKAIP